MAKCTYCGKKIEMRPNSIDRMNKVKRPRMEWVYLKDIRWATVIESDHFVVGFSEEAINSVIPFGQEVVIGEQAHYIGDEAPPIRYESWYLEEHPELSN